MKAFVTFIITALLIGYTCDAQWQQMNGPLGGPINCIDRNGDKIVAGSNIGVYLSVDGGKSWDMIGLSDHRINAVLININSIFAGTPDGLYITADNGNTWLSYLDGTDIRSLELNDTNIFAGGSWLYLSTNNGQTWSSVSSGLDLGPWIIYDIASGDNDIYLGSDNEIVYLSSDYGNNWHNIGDLFGSPFPVTALAVSDTILAAGTYIGIFLFSYEDSTWKFISTDLPQGNVNTLCISEGNIFAGTYSGFYVSSNYGNDWTLIDSEFKKYRAVTDMHVYGNEIFIGTYDGMFFSSDNGLSWDSVYTGIANNNVISLSIIDSDIFASADEHGGDLFLSSNNGSDWIPANNGLDEHYKQVNQLVKFENNLFAATTNGIYLSKNNGYTWSPSDSGLTATMETLVVKGNNIFAGGSKGIYFSNDTGSHWSNVSQGQTSYRIVKLVTIGNTILAGSSGGGIYRSPDDGVTWSRSDNGIPYNVVLDLLSDGSNLFASIYGFGGVYLSSNNGEIWSEANNGLKSTYITSLTKSNEKLFAGSYDAGVFVSINNGSNWFEINEGLTNKKISSLAVNDSFIFAGTDGNGVWRRPLSEISEVTEIKSQQPITIYPNPAKDIITIENSTNTVVLILFYNIQGQLVMQLSIKEGMQDINIKELEKGIYLVKIKDIHNTLVMKLIKE